MWSLWDITLPDHRAPQRTIPQQADDIDMLGLAADLNDDPATCAAVKNNLATADWTDVPAQFAYPAPPERTYYLKGPFKGMQVDGSTRIDTIFANRTARLAKANPTTQRHIKSSAPRK